MEEAIQRPNNQTTHESTKTFNRSLLIINCTFLALGTAIGPLILRLYFIHGGNRKWLSSFLETAAFPILIIPLSISYMLRHRQARSNSCTTNTKLFLITPRLIMSSAFIGLLIGIDDYMYAAGLSYLPVSTSSILISSQLAFTSLFALVLVKQKFTPYSINSVVLLTLGAVVLGLHADGDRPAHVSNSQYYWGFFITLGAAILYGFILPLLELTYAKAGLTITYTLVMEMQFVMFSVATALCTVGMYLDNDFKVIGREGREFDLGEVKYYVILIVSGIVWQLFFLGSVGVVFSASSLVSGIIIAVMIPVTEVLAVIFYREKFKGEKGLSLALSLWGFVSYFYGEHRSNVNRKKTRSEPEMSSQ